MGSNQLSCIPSWEDGGSLNDTIPYVHLFKIDAILDQFVDIVTYLMMGRMRDEWTITQNKQLVTRR